MQSPTSEKEQHYALLHTGGPNALKAALQKRFWGLLLDKSNMSQQCALTAEAANCMLGCISKSRASTLGEIIIHLYSVLCEDHI